MRDILPYVVLPARYTDYDAAAPAVAARAGALIERAARWVEVEHVGSTAVPDCSGKGIVDLMTLYPPGKLPDTRIVIDSIGFQHQQAGHTFPEERPMRVGAIEYGGKLYRLHVHVIESGSEEAESMRRFRDTLRARPELRDAYQARKRAILEAGMSEPADYTHAKGEFINAVLAGRDAH
jgi:GrpB-like predicted nucleotidyltransferase (UPF0157 family)